jgi:tight adherence protein C
MTRVANELARVTPAISEEFLMLQMEIQAGKDRDRAFLDMAERTGVDEVSSFSNVILQATQFGTSVSDALATYAADMRLDRELRAQEKANKLPVKMSGVMAALMMPTLLMLILSPVLIRWIRVMNVE